MVMVLGLGALAFAGPLTGTWDTSISIDPSAVDFGDFFVSFSSTLGVDYTVGGWTFGSSSTFSQDGYSAQSFTGAGVLGAFSFDSTMVFLPMAVTEEVHYWNTTYIGVTYDMSQTVSRNALLALMWNPFWCDNDLYSEVTEPAFDTWTVEGSVSIAGINFGGLFYLDAWSGAKTVYDPLMKEVVTNHSAPGDPLAGTVVLSIAVGDKEISGDTLGSGWRFEASGDVAPGMTLTSYTYFNLSQADATSLTGCPVIGKKAAYSIAGDGCGVAFTEEYVTLEGLGFGCVTDIDLALKVTCDGFDYFKIVVGNIPFLSWVDLQLGITFTETAKEVTLCGSMDALGDDCFTIDVGLNTVSFADATISSVEIYGISVAHTWNGISFSSDTSFNTAEHAIKGNIESADKVIIEWPFASDYDSFNTAADPAVQSFTFVGNVNGTWLLAGVTPGYMQNITAFLEPYCMVTEYYEVFESVGIESTGDGCCGGAFDFSVTTYFGTKYELVDDISSLYYEWYGADYDDDGLLGATEFWTFGSFPTGYTAPAVGDTIGTATDGIYTDAGDYGINGDAYEVASDGATLFGWVETELSATIGLSSNFSLTGGLGISVYGWESLDFGFTFTF